MKTFTGYRPHPPAHYLESGNANPPNEPQYEGCVFSDGRVAVRWLTACRSFSIWDSFEDFAQVHGHADYGTIISWGDDGHDTIPPIPALLEGRI